MMYLTQEDKACCASPYTLVLDPLGVPCHAPSFCKFFGIHEHALLLTGLHQPELGGIVIHYIHFFIIYY